MSNLGLKVHVYDAKFTYETNLAANTGPVENQVRILPKNKVIFIPNGSLSGDNAYFATAPIAGPKYDFKPGRQSWLKMSDTPPWTVTMGVQHKAFPIMRASKEIFVLTVW